MAKSNKTAGVASGHGVMVLGTAMSGFAAIGALGLALYQAVFSIPEQGDRITVLQQEAIATEARLQNITASYRDLRSQFGETEEEVELAFSRIREASELVGQLNRDGVFARIDRGMQDVERLRQEMNTLESGLNAVTQATLDPVRREEPIDFGVKEGVIRLPNRAVAAVELTDVTVTREGEYVVIGGEMESAVDRVSVEIQQATVVLDDGRELTDKYPNIGRTGWNSRRTAELRPGVPVSVQWRFEISSMHESCRVIEMKVWNGTKNERGLIQFRNVAVPK